MKALLPTPALGEGGPRLVDARKLVRWIGRWRPLRIETDDALGRSHAWRISGVWDRTQKRWEVQIDPVSYVNGQEVLAPELPASELPEATLLRLAASGGLPDRARPWLSEAPSLPVRSWRAVGTDALAINGESETIPEYFLEQGVVPPDNLSTAGDQLTIQLSGSPEQLRTRRYLRAVDVVLHQPRPSATLDIGDDNRPQVRLVTPPDDRPFVTIQSAAFEPAGVAASIQDEFAGAIADDGIDSLKLGTLWLLSPLGLAPGRDPDGSWSAFGQNAVFYSLDHDSNLDVDIIEPINLGFDIPLAGGVAALTIAGLKSEIEANDAYASAFLSKGRVVGAFRTV